MLNFRVLAMVRRGVLPFIVCLAAAVAAGCGRSAGESGSGTRGDVALARDSDVTEAVVPRNATLETILRSEQLPPELSAPLVTAVREVFNPRHIRANQPYRITRTLDGLFREQATELDIGDPVDLGRRYVELRRKLPHINVLGGCCGTDHRHVEQIAFACMAVAA